MNQTTHTTDSNDEAAKSRRHSEFRHYQSDTYLESAACDILHNSGWRFLKDEVKTAQMSRILKGTAYYGHWITKEDGPYSRPMGDAREWRSGAYSAVQLYTDTPLETLQEMAAQFRAEDRANGFWA